MLILVTQNRLARQPLIRYLHQNGIYLHTTAYETALALCQQKDTGGVLLDCVGALGAGERLCRELRSNWPKIPIGAIAARGAIPCMAADMILRNEGSLLQNALDFCIACCGWRAAGSVPTLTLTDDPQQTLYMGYHLPLSPTEHALLKCLFYRAPSETSYRELESLCFPLKTEQHTSLTAQIARINRLATKIDPRPLILNRYGHGYRLRDGILPLKERILP